VAHHFLEEARRGAAAMGAHMEAAQRAVVIVALLVS